MKKLSERVVKVKFGRNQWEKVDKLATEYFSGSVIYEVWYLQDDSIEVHYIIMNDESRKFFVEILMMLDGVKIL